MATEPHHLGYMSRLPLFGRARDPFPEGFGEFQLSVKEGGVAMMEMVCMHLKAQGALVSRTLSFEECGKFISFSFLFLSYFSSSVFIIFIVSNHLLLFLFL
jgi:hypothetical protein